MSPQISSSLHSIKTCSLFSQHAHVRTCTRLYCVSHVRVTSGTNDLPRRVAGRSRSTQACCREIDGQVRDRLMGTLKVPSTALTDHRVLVLMSPRPAALNCSVVRVPLCVSLRPAVHTARLPGHSFLIYLPQREAYGKFRNTLFGYRQ